MKATAAGEPSIFRPQQLSSFYASRSYRLPPQVYECSELFDGFEWLESRVNVGSLGIVGSITYQEVPEDMSNVTPWPNPTGRPVEPPKPINRPCDYSLVLAMQALETQLGTIEGYNRLCQAAAALKAKIDAGQAEPQNPLFAVSVKGKP